MTDPDNLIVDSLNSIKVVHKLVVKNIGEIINVRIYADDTVTELDNTHETRKDMGTQVIVT